MWPSKTLVLKWRQRMKIYWRVAFRLKTLPIAPAASEPLRLCSRSPDQSRPQASLLCFYPTLQWRLTSSVSMMFNAQTYPSSRERILQLTASLILLSKSFIMIHLSGTTVALPGPSSPLTAPPRQDRNSCATGRDSGKVTKDLWIANVSGSRADTEVVAINNRESIQAKGQGARLQMIRDVGPRCRNVTAHPVD